ncbi:MAG: META domain-containing protein [Bacteroidetes bacterium]|nr:MAG: META domain-containing protein [Bacteroidota bacterium]TAG85757.1 MAG: META domain-containing protein [Bacteroidota bacterium]
MKKNYYLFMKLFTIFLIFLFACSSEKKISKEAKINNQNDKNPFEQIIGIYWMSKYIPTSHHQGFMFTSKNSFTGFDGCNTFKGSFSYDNLSGFKLKNMPTTELKCQEGKKKFDNSFFYSAFSFEIKENQIIFYDKEKKEIKCLVSLQNIEEKEKNIFLGEWKMTESNHEYFKSVQKNKTEPYLRLLKNLSFVICYHHDKSKGWTQINYFAGYYNFNKKDVFFYVNSMATASAMDSGEDTTLAYSLKDANFWEFKNDKIVIKNQDIYFIFEKL